MKDTKQNVDITSINRTVLNVSLILSEESLAQNKDLKHEEMQELNWTATEFLTDSLVL